MDREFIATYVFENYNPITDIFPKTHYMIGVLPVSLELVIMIYLYGY